MMPRSRRHRLWLTLGTLLIAACGGSPTEPRIPTQITVSPTSVALTAAGQTQQIVATVTDQHGVAITSPSISWSSDNTSVATVTGTGLISAVGNGSATVTATAGSVSTTVSVTVTVFSIELQFLSTPTAAQQQAFVAAQQRWQGLIAGDVPDVQLSAAAGQCGDNSPALNRSVDDLLILVTLKAIDGVGGTLAQSGPCFIRTTGRLPAVGLMIFDTADLDMLQNLGLMSAVVVHEMGHVLGFGTIWSDSLLATGALLADPTCAGPTNDPCSTGHDPHFTGSQALVAFNSVGGSGYTASARVPVEDTTLVGTADSHWRESVFGNELMTGFVDTSNPLSRVTIASMQDLGYAVNFTGADPYTLPPFTPGLRALVRRGPRIELKNDLLRLPIRVVDEAGRVERVIQP